MSTEKYIGIETVMEMAGDVATDTMMERYLLKDGEGNGPDNTECPLFDYDAEEEMSSWKEEYQDEFDKEYDKWFEYFRVMLGVKI